MLKKSRYYMVACLALGLAVTASAKGVVDIDHTVKSRTLSEFPAVATVDMKLVKSISDPALYCKNLYNELYKKNYGGVVNIRFISDQLNIPVSMTLSGLVKWLVEYYYPSNDQSRPYTLDWATANDYHLTQEKIDQIPTDSSEKAIRYILQRVINDNGLDSQGINIDINKLSKVIRVTVDRGVPTERNAYQDADYFPDGQSVFSSPSSQAIDSDEGVDSTHNSTNNQSSADQSSPINSDFAVQPKANETINWQS
jgi:hypothetical protein